MGFVVMGIQNAKKFCWFFFLFFELPLRIYELDLQNANLFLISYLEEFQPVKYYLSRINTSKNIRLRKLYVPIMCPKQLIHYIELGMCKK